MSNDAHEDRKTYPASEESAASENPRSPQIPARNMTSHTAFTGVWVYGLMRFHQREPGKALSRANANTTRDASTPCAAPVTYYTFDDVDQVGLRSEKEEERTCTTMIKLQIASMPLWPRTSRKSWPMGKGNVLSQVAVTLAVAKDAAMSSSQPRTAVALTPTRIAIGALRAAPAVSSEI